MQNFVFDYVVLPARRSKHGGEICNSLFEFGKFLFEFADFEMSERFKTHIDNCLRLVFREVETFAQRLFCFLRGLRRLDYPYDFVDVANGNQQSAHDFRTLFCGFEFKRRSADDYFALICDVICQNVFQSHLLGFAARNGDHID